MADIFKNEQKKQFFRTKHEMEQYRHVILFVNSVLKWEQKYYPGVIFGVVSVVFLFMWYLDLSSLTLASLVLLLVAVVDYLYPRISKFIFKTENWTGAQEKAFESVISEIVEILGGINAGYCYMQQKQSEKNTFYLLAYGTTLLILAWIGATVDNLFLSYIGVLSLLLYPGLNQHGLIKTLTNVVQGFFSVHLNKLKSSNVEAKDE